MADLKPIETHYKGYRFRSRLEARWAVFFDALGIEWEYEKEGYDLGEAGWYLPDFWLPDHRCFVEIKGQPATIIEWEKADALCRLSGMDVLIAAGQIGHPDCTVSGDTLREPQRRIYLAGKISSNDWREDIVRGLGDTCIDLCYNIPRPEDGWPILQDAILERHAYTGPYFVDAHGAGHGDNTHGVGVNEPSFYDMYNHAHDFGGREEWVALLAQRAIRASDCFFAWIDSTDCYGTLCEIGYAVACGIETYVESPRPIPDDLWFAGAMAGGANQSVYYKDVSPTFPSTPQEALQTILQPEGVIYEARPPWVDTKTLEDILRAETKARSARFEHGERG